MSDELLDFMQQRHEPMLLIVLTGKPGFWNLCTYKCCHTFQKIELSVLLTDTEKGSQCSPYKVDGTTHQGICRVGVFAEGIH